MNDLNDEFVMELWDDILMRPHMQLRNLKLDKNRMPSEGVRNFAHRFINVESSTAASRLRG